MSREIIFELEARLEFEDAILWYDGQQPGLGDRFEAAVHATFLRILENPDRFQLSSRTVHKAKVMGFDSYSIYFSIEAEFIGIVSVFHGARDPAELSRRLK